MSENISSVIDNELKSKDLDHGLNELKNSSSLSSFRISNDQRCYAK